MVTLYVYKNCQRWMELFAVVKESEGHGRVFFFILLVGRAEQAELREQSGDGMGRREAARNPRRQLHLPSSNSLAVKNSRPNGHCNPAHLPETRTKSCSTFLVVTLESRDIADSYILRLPACTYTSTHMYFAGHLVQYVCCRFFGAF